MNEADIKAAHVLGVRVDSVGMTEAVERVLAWTEHEPLNLAVGINAHVCNTAAADPDFARLIDSSDLNYPDGQSVVWAARLLGTQMPERVATTDLIYPLIAQLAARRKRVFFFGGPPGIAEAAAQRLRVAYAGVEIRAEHGYLTGIQTARLIGEINDWRPDVLFVGLGDPLQQRWVARYREQLSVPAILTCGGLFDWTSGANRRPPQWMISGGLEWLWRVLLEPRRLSRRYLIGNPLFLARLTRQYLHQLRQRLGVARAVPRRGEGTGSDVD